jgi:hypothetical protein
MTPTNASRRPASPNGEPVQPDLQVLEADPKSVQRRRTTDNLLIAGVLVLLSVFMVGMMRYVLSPAVKTVTNATTGSSGAGGP